MTRFFKADILIITNMPPANWKLIERDSGFWIFDAQGPLVGPLGSIQEVREWLDRHNLKEFETITFYKLLKNETPAPK